MPYDQAILLVIVEDFILEIPFGTNSENEYCYIKE